MSGGIIHNPDLALVLCGEIRPQGMQPCPRCDGKDLWPEVSFDDPWGIYCAGCSWVGPRVTAADDNPDQAIAAWNDEARKVRLARSMGLKVNLVQPMPEAEDVC